jgi:hypothetical protein
VKYGIIDIKMLEKNNGLYQSSMPVLRK